MEYSHRYPAYPTQEVAAELERHIDVHFVPPFVSSTHPVDPTSMTFERGSDRVSVPDGFRDAVADAAE